MLNHDFIEGMKGDCFICHESRDQHRQIIEVRNNPRSRSISGKSNNEEEAKIPILIKNQSANYKEGIEMPQFNFDEIRNRSKSLAEKLIKERGNTDEIQNESNTCQICFDQKTEGEFFKGLGEECGHNRFCMECTRGQLVVLINDSKIMKIKCFDPKCTALFTNKHVEEVLKTSEETINNQAPLEQINQLRSIVSSSCCWEHPWPGWANMFLLLHSFSWHSS